MNKFLNYNFLIRIGLGAVFLSNALAAFFAPTEFIELLKHSFIFGTLPFRPEVFVWAIGVNDALVALLLISGFFTRRVAIWAFIWLVGVIIIIGSPFDILEHVGLLFMALALVLGDKYLTKNI